MGFPRRNHDDREEQDGDRQACSSGAVIRDIIRAVKDHERHESGEEDQEGDTEPAMS